MTGRFITFEGPDGSGKTTQLKYLVNLLESDGHEVVQTREPGGTALAEEIRSILLSGRVKSDKAELLLFAAARADHVENLIKPAIAAGKIVVCDRFADSSYAYQGAARGMQSDVEELERFTLRGFEPDFTLFFHVTLEESMRRLFNRSEDRNIFDTFARDFKKAVYNGYQKRLLTNPHRMYKVDAMKTMGEVALEIYEWYQTVLKPDLHVSDLEQTQLHLPPCTS